MHAKYTTYGLSWISKCWFNVSNDRKQLNSNLRGILYEIILKKKICYTGNIYKSIL